MFYFLFHSLAVVFFNSFVGNFFNFLSEITEIKSCNLKSSMNWNKYESEYEI